MSNLTIVAVSIGRVGVAPGLFAGSTSLTLAEITVPGKIKQGFDGCFFHNRDIIDFVINNESNSPENARLYVSKSSSGVITLITSGGAGDVLTPTTPDMLVRFVNADGEMADSGFFPSDFLQVANNLSDVASPSAALTNIGGVSTSDVIDTAHGGTGLPVGTVTKGTLFSGDGAPDTLVQIPVGTNGQVLAANSGVTGGLEWVSNGVFPWVTIVGTTQAMAANTGYICTNVGLTTLTLPATFGVGDNFFVLASSAGGWTIAQNAGQSIRLGNVVTTVGVGGSLASTLQGDSLQIIGTAANTTLQAPVAPQGNITVV